MYNIIFLVLTIVYSNVLFAQNLVKEIGLNENYSSDEIYINLDKKSDYKLFQLDNPNRVVIDLYNSKTNIKNFNIQSKLIKKIRSGIREKYNLRLVIETEDEVSISKINSQYIKNEQYCQLIIKINYQKKPSKNLSFNKKKNYERINIQAQIKKIRKPTVVIDPGHGGEDPGAIGRYTNIYEKDITLKYAKTLAILLERTNSYNVFLTRSKDKFMTLANRVAKAKELKADLFISLHADSHADPKIQGLSVYTISEDKQENKISAIKNQLISVSQQSQKDDINEILTNLIERKNKNIAIEFATSLISIISKEVAVINNSHRFGGFKILRNEEVPAVLIELGYLSNKYEEKILDTEQYRTKIINSLILAINHHFNKN